MKIKVKNKLRLLVNTIPLPVTIVLAVYFTAETGALAWGLVAGYLIIDANKAITVEKGE